MQLFFSELFSVFGRLNLLLLWLLNFIRFVVVLLLLSSFAWLSVLIKVLSNELGQLVSVNAGSQDLTSDHELLAVFSFFAKFGSACQLKLICDEDLDSFTDTRVVFELVTRLHVFFCVH